MTINLCEVCLAAIICSIITIVLYIASWYRHKENNEEEFKEPGVSNMQGLDNEKPVPRGEPNETINFDVKRHFVTSESQPSDEIIKEKSDLCFLQAEDLRARATKNASDEHHIVDDYVNVECHDSLSSYDSVIHSDSTTGRLHLSIRYDDERSKLIVQILNAQGLIRPEQISSPEMCLTFSLIGLSNNVEKHTRIILENAAISWKEPLTFCITFANVIKQNLYIKASNTTDPTAIRDRELSIPLNTLGNQNKDINKWFDLQYIQSRS